MKKKRSIYSLLFFLILMTVINAQQETPARMQMPEGGCKFLNNSESTSVPFTISDNLIVIQVELKGIIFNLILDSGMPMEGALLFGSEKVTAANLSFTSKMPVGGVGGEPLLSDIAMGLDLKVANLELTNQMIIVLPQNKGRSLLFEGKDGIIGFSFLSKFIVEIDYENQVIIFTKPEIFNPEGKGQMIPIEVSGNRIFVNAQVKLNDGSSALAGLVVDTGNRSALMLNSCYNEKLGIPSDAITYFVHGLNSKLKRKAARITSIQLGDYTLENVLTSFNDCLEGSPPPWEKEGNLGNAILKRFNVTFDIPGNRLFLKKNGVIKDEFEFNMAGLQFHRDYSGNYIVYNVVPGSPADKAQIILGDKIIKVNKRKTSGLTLDEIENDFRKLGSEISIIIERDGEMINLSFTLLRII